jgi:hypothetical protein
MRTVLRLILATAAVTALAFGGASAALASSDQLPAFTERYEFHDEWCFDQGSWTDCTVSHGTMVVTYTPNIRATARIHFRSDTIAYDNVTGEQIGTTKTRSLDTSVYEDGFQSKTFEVEHTRYDGPLGTCVVTYKLLIVDYELVVDTYLGPGCR